MWGPNSCFWNHHEATYNDMKCLGFADGESGRFLDGRGIAANNQIAGQHRLSAARVPGYQWLVEQPGRNSLNQGQFPVPRPRLRW